MYTSSSRSPLRNAFFLCQTARVTNQDLQLVKEEPELNLALQLEQKSSNSQCYRFG